MHHIRIYISYICVCVHALDVDVFVSNVLFVFLFQCLALTGLNVSNDVIKTWPHCWVQTPVVKRYKVHVKGRKVQLDLSFSQVNWY